MNANCKRLAKAVNEQMNRTLKSIIDKVFTESNSQEECYVKLMKELGLEDKK